MKNARTLVGLLLAACLLPAVQATAEIRFDDVTTDAGVAHSTQTYGASWGDLDGDGFPDLFVSNHWSQPSLFLNRGAEGGFLDVARQTFQWTWTPRADTHGATWFDFDNDGDQDLFLTTGIGNPDQFLVNENGVLVNRTRELGVSFSAWGGRLPVWMDFDGDGRPDFAMMMIGRPVQVMRQTEDGFEAVTDDLGVSCLRQSYGQLIDVTGDGRLDFVCPEDGEDLRYPLRIYDMQTRPWTEIPVSERFPEVIAGPDAIVADFNNDGYMDIFHLSGMQNRPSGAATNEAGTRLEARLMGEGKGIRFRASGSIEIDIDSNVFHEDFDNRLGSNWIRIGRDGNTPPSTDGEVVTRFRLDPADPDVHGLVSPENREPPLVRIGYEEGEWWVILHSKDDDGESVFTDIYLQVEGRDLELRERIDFWEDDFAARPTLLLFDPERGAFVDATPEALDRDMECVSAAAADFDNDMWVDLYLACRTAVSNIENMLFRNTGDGNFERIDDAGGAIGPLGLAVADGAGTADSVVMADFDVDGRVDLFVANGFNMFPKGIGGPNRLYRNTTVNDHRWIQIDLEGRTVHREAIGTVVHARAGGVTQTRVRDGGHHRWSQNHARLHFGLGEADEVDIEVRWPDGTVDLHEGVAPNLVYAAVQNGELRPVEIGDAKPYACGLPDAFDGLDGGGLDQALPPGLYIARNCRVDLEGLDPERGVQPGGWSVRATRGMDGTLTYAGRIESTAPVAVEDRPGLNEDHDIVDISERAIDFVFEVRGGQDGVEFSPEYDANTCISVDVPEGAAIYYGPLMRRVDATAFYLDTLAPCPDGVPEVPSADGEDPADEPPGDGGGDVGGGDTPGDADPGTGNGGDGSADNPPVASSGNGGGGGSGSLDPLVLVTLAAGLGFIARRRHRLPGG